MTVFALDVFGEDAPSLVGVDVDGVVEMPEIEEFEGVSHVEMTISVEKNSRQVQLHFKGETECGYLFMIGVSDVAKDYIVGRFDNGHLSLAFAPMGHEGSELACVMPNNKGVIEKNFTLTIPGKFGDLLTKNEVDLLEVQVMGRPVTSDFKKVYDFMIFQAKTKLEK